MDFMLSPTGISSSPRRTLSRASKTSSIDSKTAASIFSGDYPSTSKTSDMSHEEVEPSVSKSAPVRPGLYRERTGSVGRALSEPRSEGKVWYASQTSRSSERREGKAATSSLDDVEPRRLLLTNQGRDEDAMEELDPINLSKSNSQASLQTSHSQQSLRKNLSGFLSRSSSIRSIEKDQDREELQEMTTRKQIRKWKDAAGQLMDIPKAATPHRIPPPACNSLLSPSTLQRKSTLTKPLGPRQLGSRSPNSPYGLRDLNDSTTTTLSPSVDDPFLPTDLSGSLTKKRSYTEDKDSDSVSSKRALRQIHEPNDNVYVQKDSVQPDKSRGTASERQSSVKREEVSINFLRQLFSEYITSLGQLRKSHARWCGQRSSTCRAASCQQPA